MKRIFILFGFILLLAASPHTVNGTSTKLDSLPKTEQNAQFLRADSANNRVRPITESNNPLLRVIWITFVLLIFLLAGMLAYKKFVLKGSVTRSTKIAILARQSIGPKQSILIVRIEDKKYAIGSTDHALNMLADLGAFLPEEDTDTTSKAVTGFGDVLKKIIKRG